MLHLSDERLAALADDEPTATEAEHLSACRRCAGERMSQRRLLAMANAAREHISPPLTEWSAIAARLRDEGMLGSGGENSGRFAAAVRPALMVSGSTTPVVAVPTVSAPVHRTAGFHWGMRAAAAIVLVAGGVVGGRLSMARGDVSPTITGVSTTASAGGPVTPVALNGAGAFPGAPDEQYPVYQTVDEAARAMEVAQMQYQYAATFIATRDTTTVNDERTFRARLAALDQIAATSRAALYRAPHDPVLNQYYLSTVGAREATLRQLDRALPVGSRMARY